MANERGKSIDNTHLSIDQANKRGFLHADYIGHCLRWTHVAKFIRAKNRYKDAVVLDVGCGRDLPLARMLHTSRIAPKLYVGVDYNKPEKLNTFEHNFGSANVEYFGNCNFSEDVTAKEETFVIGENEYEAPNIIVCFEVLEHVEPSHARQLVRRMVEVARQDQCDLFISTPNWDPRVGAAANHVNEMKHEAVGYLLESEGLAIQNYYGVFASQKDYKLHDWLNKDEVDPETLSKLWDALHEYYDSNYLATIFAPLFPAQARNCLWHCRIARGDEQPSFGTPSDEEPFTSSEKWKELLL